MTFERSLQSALSAQLNGSFQKFTTLFTNSPQINPIFTVVDDPTGVHYLSGSVGCTAKHYEKLMGVKNHANCFDNLAKAVEPWGLGHYDVHGPFNAFMRVRWDENGNFNILAPVAKKEITLTSGLRWTSCWLSLRAPAISMRAMVRTTFQNPCRFRFTMHDGSYLPEMH